MENPASAAERQDAGGGRRSSARAPRRSRIRAVVAVLVVAAVVVGGGVAGLRWWIGRESASAVEPWFGGYVDVTTRPAYPFEQRRAGKAENVVMSFVVASPTNACTPSWGIFHTLASAATDLHLDRRIALLRKRSGDVVVSFGGPVNQDLALACTDPIRLLGAYRTVVQRYALNTIDLDMEGSALTDTAAQQRRDEAIATLQRERRAVGKPLAVWLTLPVIPNGLLPDSTDAVARMLAAHVDLAGVNLMTMDYGPSLATGASMLGAAERAVTVAHRQLAVLYDHAHLHQTSEGVWNRLGVTPMIGQNDTVGQSFSLADARALSAFAKAHHLGRISMWSANRDTTCAPGIDTRTASAACSGVDQGRTSFTTTLGRGFVGRLATAATRVTRAVPTPAPMPDYASTTRDPIWSRTKVYLKGARIVWHRQIYVAKWWSRSDVPGRPVLVPWDSPWKRIGPVPPGQDVPPRPPIPPELIPSWSEPGANPAGADGPLNEAPFRAWWGGAT